LRIRRSIIGESLFRMSFAGCVKSMALKLMSATCGSEVGAVEPLQGSQPFVIRKPRVRRATLGCDVQPLRGKDYPTASL
jgi:hypothetical protein